MDLGIRVVVIAAIIFGRYFVINSVKRNTKHIVKVAILFGIAAAAGALVFNGLALSLFNLKDGIEMTNNASFNEIAISTAVFVAIEEIVKFVPLALFLNRKPYFSMLSDGVLFFGLAGLTFGAIEHVLYGLSYGQFTVLLRVFLVLFLHAGLTGTVGYFYVKDKLLGNRSRTFFALLFSMSLHYAYNMSLFLAGKTNDNLRSLAISTVSVAIATGVNCLLVWLFYLASQHDWRQMHTSTQGPVQPVTHSLIY